MSFACWHVGRKFQSIILIWAFIMKYLLTRFDKQGYYNILYSYTKNSLLIGNKSISFICSDLDNQLTVTTYIWIWGFLKVTYLKKRTTYIIHKLNIPIRTLSRYEKTLKLVPCCALIKIRQKRYSKSSRHTINFCICAKVQYLCYAM